MNLAFAEWLIRRGVPVFRIRMASDGTFSPPPNWQTSTPTLDVLDRVQPGDGLGAVCGHGLDVLDWDPRNDPDGSGLKILDTIDAYAVVSTPSGGLHLYVDSLHVRKRGLVLPGIDLQAGTPEGGRGFVFIPPTQRPSKLDGQMKAYVLTGQKEHVRAQDLSWIAALAQLSATPNVGQAPTPGIHDERGARYAKAALDAAIQGYLDAPAGTGETVAIAGLCRTLELANAPWAGLEGADYLTAWEIARETRQQEHAGRGGQTRQDWQRLWGSARTRVGSREAHYPAEPKSITVGGEGPPAPNARTESPDSETIAPSGLRAKLHTAETLEQVPRPRWLVNKWLMLDSICGLIGRSSSWKSFIALDLAGHVSRGDDWHGYRTLRGSVLHIVAEGGSGHRQRVEAWQEVYGRLPDEYMMLLEPVQAGIPTHWAPLVQLVEELKPVLIILDTQARMTVGINENDNSEMGVYIERIEQLRRVSGACVLSVHHAGHGELRGRGASAVYGALTSEMTVERDREAGTAEISTTKEKDGRDDLALTVTAQVIEVGEDEYGEPITSLAITQPNEVQVWIIGSRTPLQVARDAIRAAFDDVVPEHGCTRAQLWSHVKEATDISRATYYRAIKQLELEGVIEADGRAHVLWLGTKSIEDDA